MVRDPYKIVQLGVPLRLLRNLNYAILISNSNILRYIFQYEGEESSHNAITG
jgi:hypothetical protein